MMKPFLLLLIVAMASCSGGDGATATVENADKADEMAGRITVMEDSMSHHVGVDRRSAQTLLDIYKGYAAAFPLDQRAPMYLFRAARVTMAMREPQQSVKLYDRIITDYPSWEDLPNVYFMKAFVYDDQLDQKGEAKEIYQKLIYAYPDHPLAAQARVAMDNLQYTDAELIERFQRMQAEQEAMEAN